MRTWKVGLLAVLCWGGAVQAADLRSPYSLETSSVLPQGVTSPRFLQLYLSHDSQFSEQGVSEPLGNGLKRNISFGQFLGSRSTPAEREQLSQLLARVGLSPTANLGQATGSLSAYVNAKVPGLGFGITDRLAIGVLVPVVSVDLNVQTRFAYSADGQRFIQTLCAANPAKCDEVKRGLDNVAQARLQSLGYLPLRSENFSGLGDIQLVGKYNAVKTDDDMLTAKLVLTFPTGTASNPDRMIDITTGDLRYRLGAVAIYDRRLFPGSRLNAYGGYTALLPNRMVRRLPLTANEPLSADKGEVVRRLGHRVSAGAGVDYTIAPIGLTLTGGYNYQYQSQSRYRSDSANPEHVIRAGYLERFEPSQSLHSAIAAAAFSTVNWYREKKFFLPLDLTFVYSRPISGRNVPNGDSVSGELIAYF